MDSTMSNPRNLYRYRRSQDYSIEALIMNDFYLSTPESFNDPYDVSFYFQPEVVKQYIQKRLSKNKLDRLVRVFNIGQGDKSSIVDDFYDLLMNRLIFEIKNNFLIACLSTECNDEVMWAHYSDNGKGFVLEYEYCDLENMIEIYKEELVNDYLDYARFNDYLKDITRERIEQSVSIFGISKVNYQDNKPSSTDTMKMLVDFFVDLIEMDIPDSRDELSQIRFNEEVLVNITKKSLLKIDSTLKDTLAQSLHKQLLLTKKQKWIYENEFRVVIPNIDLNFRYESSTYRKFTGLKPSAIIMGEFMNLRNRFTCAKIAYENKIPLKEIKSNFNVNPPKIEVRDVNFTKILNDEEVDKC